MRIRFIATIAFFSLIYTFFYSLLPDSLIIFYKLFPMILIILLASTIPSNNHTYKKSIILALTFFIIGDVTHQWFIVSLTSFLVVLSIGWVSFKTVSHLAIAGSLLFIAFNVIVFIHTFISPIDHSHQIMMLTYYTAQLLLALSIADYSETKTKDGTMKQT